jgi:putative transposase
VKTEIAYKLRIYPNKKQKTFLNKTFGCCRFLWNHMLAEHNQVYQRLKSDKKALHAHKYKTEKQYKQEYEFLKEPDAKALQNVNRNLFQAFQNFFDSVKGKRPIVGYPRFKSRKNRQSYKTNNINNNVKIDFTRKKLKLPKVEGWVSYRDDRTFDESIKSVALSRTKSGKYHASILIERRTNIQQRTEVEEGKITAFDMSFASFLVSEHKRFENPRFYRRNENRLKRLHKRLSRKQKGSRNRDKARVMLARFYDKITNAKGDWLHKESVKLVREFDVIVLENIHVEGVKQFSKGFAKTVTLDFSWGEFTRMLGYKMQRFGKHLVLVDRFFPSSKTCSSCGYVNGELELSDRQWVCASCGVRHDRDVNAAVNIRLEGIRVLREERNIKIITSCTAGTAGSHASGDRVRPVKAVVDEGRIHAL